MKRKPLIIYLGLDDVEYVPLLVGETDSVSMRSGAVSLQPGRTVGIHSTGKNEELLIILNGSGTFFFNENEELEFKEGTVLYCPPDTTHDVKNTGPGLLRYIYVVSKA